MVLNPAIGNDADAPSDLSNSDDIVESRSFVIETVARDLTLKEGKAVLEFVELRSTNYSEAMEQYEEGSILLQEAIDKVEGITSDLNSAMYQKRTDMISDLKKGRNTIKELEDYVHVEYENMNK